GQLRAGPPRLRHLTETNAKTHAISRRGRRRGPMSRLLRIMRKQATYAVPGQIDHPLRRHFTPRAIPLTRPIADRNNRARVDSGPGATWRTRHRSRQIAHQPNVLSQNRLNLLELRRVDP